MPFYKQNYKQIKRWIIFLSFQTIEWWVFLIFVAPLSLACQHSRTGLWMSWTMRSFHLLFPTKYLYIQMITCWLLVFCFGFCFILNNSPIIYVEGNTNASSLEITRSSTYLFVILSNIWYLLFNMVSFFLIRSLFIWECVCVCFFLFENSILNMSYRI